MGLSLSLLIPLGAKRCIHSLNPQTICEINCIVPFILKMEKLMSRDVNHLSLLTRL